MDRDRFGRLTAEMADKLGDDMQEACMKAFDALTFEERARLGDPNMPYLLVRAIAMVVAPDVIDNRYAAEAAKPLATRVKRILSKRYY